jgi:hypothetical protein
MPAKTLWLLHIPEIVSQLENVRRAAVNRAIIERLFGLRRRQAVELLHRSGGRRTGRTLLVDRRLPIECPRGLAVGENSSGRAGVRNGWSAPSIDAAFRAPFFAGKRQALTPL